MPAGGILKKRSPATSEFGWIEEDVRAMDTIEAQSINKQGQTETYTGVSINMLLEMAGPAADATTLAFGRGEMSY